MPYEYRQYFFCCMVFSGTSALGMHWDELMDIFFGDQPPIIIQSTAMRANKRYLSTQNGVTRESSQEPNVEKVSPEQVEPPETIVNYTYKPIVSAAYFKHFKSAKRLREVVVFYDRHGDTLRSIEVTGVSDYASLFALFKEKLLSHDATTISIAYRKRALSCLISYTRLHDIVAIEKKEKRSGAWRGIKKGYSFLNEQELARLDYEIANVAYCSAHDQATNQALCYLREQ